LDDQLFAQPTAQAAPQVTLLATRLKLADERYQNLAKRNQITEESLLSFEREIKLELRALTKQTVELSRHISEINMKMDQMLGELQQVVRKHELTAAERYLELWQPMDFITRDEAKRLIEGKLMERNNHA
jgi:hypothetical protein